MTIHYHGTPISPRSQLYKMAGRHFCVSFAAPQDFSTCLQIGQSVMLDNGAFSVWRRNLSIDWDQFYSWVEPALGHPHWAVVPDVIGGGVEDNAALLMQWPHPRELAAAVWHTDEPIDWLLDLVQQGWGKICLGSASGLDPGSDRWNARLTEAFNALAKRGPLPWVHMLRGLGQVRANGFPFASADSVNVGRNFKDGGKSAETMASAIDSVQAPVKWSAHPEQLSLHSDEAMA